MLFAISCIDKPGHAELRKKSRDDHLAYLRQHGDQVVLAGPYIDEDGTGMTGSLIIIDVPDRTGADNFATNDPYNKAGLFERVSVRGWKKVIPAT